jgi:hypothetical protein
MNAKELTLDPKSAIEMADFYRKQAEYYGNINDRFMERKFKVRYDAIVQILDKYLTTTVNEFSLGIANSNVYKFALGLIGNQEYVQRQLGEPVKMDIEDAEIIEDAKVIKEQINTAETINNQNDLGVSKKEIATKVITAVENNRIFAVNKYILDFLQENSSYVGKDMNDVALAVAIKHKRDVLRPVRDIAANIMQYASITEAKMRIKVMLANWSSAELERFLKETALLYERRLDTFKLGRTKDESGACTKNIFVDAPKGNKELLEALINREELRSIRLNPTDSDMEPSLRRQCAEAFVRVIPHGKEFDRKRKELLKQWKASGDPGYNEARKNG